MQTTGLSRYLDPSVGRTTDLDRDPSPTRRQVSPRKFSETEATVEFLLVSTTVVSIRLAPPRRLLDEAVALRPDLVNEAGLWRRLSKIVVEATEPSLRTSGNKPHGNRGRGTVTPSADEVGDEAVVPSESDLLDGGDYAGAARTRLLPSRPVSPPLGVDAAIEAMLLLRSLRTRRPGEAFAVVGFDDWTLSPGLSRWPGMDKSRKGGVRSSEDYVMFGLKGHDRQGVPILARLEDGDRDGYNYGRKENRRGGRLATMLSMRVAGPPHRTPESWTSSAAEVSWNPEHRLTVLRALAAEGRRACVARMQGDPRATSTVDLRGVVDLASAAAAWKEATWRVASMPNAIETVDPSLGRQTFLVACGRVAASTCGLPRSDGTLRRLDDRVAEIGPDGAAIRNDRGVAARLAFAARGFAADLRRGGTSTVLMEVGIGPSGPVVLSLMPFGGWLPSLVPDAVLRRREEATRRLAAKAFARIATERAAREVDGPLPPGYLRRVASTANGRKALEGMLGFLLEGNGPQDNAGIMLDQDFRAVLPPAMQAAGRRDRWSGLEAFAVAAAGDGRILFTVPTHRDDGRRALLACILYGERRIGFAEASAEAGRTTVQPVSKESLAEPDSAPRRGAPARGTTHIRHFGKKFRLRVRLPNRGGTATASIEEWADRVWSGRSSLELTEAPEGAAVVDLVFGPDGPLIPAKIPEGEYRDLPSDEDPEAPEHALEHEDDEDDGTLDAAGAASLDFLAALLDGDDD